MEKFNEYWRTQVTDNPWQFLRDLGCDEKQCQNMCDQLEARELEQMKQQRANLDERIKGRENG